VHLDADVVNGRRRRDGQHGRAERDEREDGDADAKVARATSEACDALVGGLRDECNDVWRIRHGRILPGC